MTPFHAIDPEQPPSPVIYGLAGETLTVDERRFFQDARPLGFILFARNCASPEQLKALTGSLRDCAGGNIPILIDQEGGRVQRLKPPHWTSYPAAQDFASRGDEALAANTVAMAQDLIDAGINVNCTPVLDVTFPETHAAIGSRSFSSDPEIVARLSAIVCRAYLDQGIIPVVKHMPGLGRADLDTHHELPAVTASAADLEAFDFHPYRHIVAEAYADAVWGMVGHALYNAFDEKTPASCSPRIIADVIRQDIGFKGLLLSDDLSMEALGLFGGVEKRAEKVLAAGCDIALHCNGDMAEMKAVANLIPRMTSEAIVRYNRSIHWFIERTTNERLAV